MRLRSSDRVTGGASFIDKHAGGHNGAVEMVEWSRRRPLPEPPDGTRLEFECGTDLYAVHRDDESSALAGYRAGDGGETWCDYGSSWPYSWADLVDRFGEDAVAKAVWLVPVPETLFHRDLWPTQIRARAGYCCRDHDHREHEWYDTRGIRHQCPGTDPVEATHDPF